ncbi:930_t:CDS:1, partial [Scutellospora calospora]
FEKVLAMSQLRSNILIKQKYKEIEIAERQYKLTNIVAPIQSYNDNENRTQETTESSPVVSDNEINLSTPNSPSAELSEFLEISDDDIVEDETEYWSHVIES